MNEQDLLDLKQDIDDAKIKIAELKGSQKHLIKQSQDDWKCDSVEQVEKKAQEKEKEIERLNEKITNGLEELEGKYDV